MTGLPDVAHVATVKLMLVPLASLPLVQLALWGCVAVLLAVTLVTLRSRWATRRPMRRCVLLSTAAHLVLIGVAASVRFAAVPPGDGLNRPVRVSLVAPLPRADEVQSAAPADPVDPPQEEVEETPVASESPAAEPAAEPEEQKPSELPEPPALLEVSSPEPADEPVVAKPPAPVPATEPEEPLEAPPLATSPGPEPDRAEPPSPVAKAVEPEATEAPAARPAEPVVAHASSPESPPGDRQSPPPAAGPPAVLAERLRPDRLQSVIEQGGSRETEQAVAEALEWLAYAQSDDGRWDASRWEGGREMYVLKHDRRGAGRNADTGVSGLALLTFLGAGHTHLEGGYRPTLTSGLNFLIKSQGADGNLAGEATDYARTYCHSMATFALAEAYALTGDERLEPSVRRGVDYLVRTQHLPSGGWRYHPAQPGDVSQLGWVVMALRSAELAGVEVPETTWQRIEFFLSQVVRGRHGGLACYQPQTPTSTSMTAEALYCRQVLGRPLRGLALDEAVGAMGAEPPGTGQANYYYWYYATLSLHHAQRENGTADAAWRTWNERLKETLVASQVSDGSNRGSWSPNSMWGGYGGRVYTTAMAAMCLEVYYRFGSVEGGEIPWMAGRPRPATAIR